MGRTVTRGRALAGGVLAVLLVVVFAVTRCGGGPDVDALPHGEERPEPVSFSGEPLWDERKLGMTAVAGVEFRGETAIVAGDTGGGYARLAVVDVRTGAPRWVVDTGSPLRNGDGAVARRAFGYHAEYLRAATGKPLVYGAGEDWTVLVQYEKGRRGRETEVGVAALSGKDGAVRWRHALVRGSEKDQRIRMLAADGRVVLASVEAEDGVDPKTVALDPASGRGLWENTDGWAYRIAGDVVLGETRGSRAPSPRGLGEDERKDADVFALDVASGRKRWSLGDAAGSSAHLQAAAGGVAAVTVRELAPARTYPVRRTMLVDVATGRATKDSPKAEDDGTSDGELYSCRDDGRALIACSGAGGRLVTIRPGAHGEPVATRKRPFGEDTMAQVVLVQQDRIFVKGSGRGDRPARYAVVDRAANRLGSAPPGEVAALSERAAAFRVSRAGSSSSTPDGLVVHGAAVGAEPSGPARTAEPTVRPPRIDAAPLWTAGAGEGPVRAPAIDTGLRAVVSTELIGDALVYTGKERQGDHVAKLVVADAATGKVRWSARDGASLGGGAEIGYLAVPRFVTTAGETLLLVRYVAAGHEQGVAALSLKDGHVRWKKQVFNGDGSVLLEAAGDRTFAVQVLHHGGAEDETVVYDTQSRRELWRKRGVEPASVGGGLVIAAKEKPAEKWTVEPVDLIAYGAPDGERRWRLGGRYREPRLLFDAGGTTVVVGTAEGGYVLDRATGRELGRTPQLSRCDGDGDALVVCQAGSGERRDAGRRAVTIQTRGGATTIRDLLETGALERYGAIGNWLVAVRPAEGEAGKSASRPRRFPLLDGAGRRLAGDLPGRPRDIAGGFAVLDSAASTPDTGVPGFTVHRVRN